MYLFRFMSNDEFQKYRSGKVMKSKKEHYKYGNKTNSKGFCFLNYSEYKPEYAFHFLSGIINPEICAVFKVEDNIVKKTWGKYGVPVKNMTKEEFYKRMMGLGNTFIANEYCTTEYSKRNFKLVKYTIPDWFNWDKWKWEECNSELQIIKRTEKQNGKRNKTVRL